jgi:CBS domain containing-hemolysin-like protein
MGLNSVELEKRESLMTRWSSSCLVVPPKRALRFVASVMMLVLWRGKIGGVALASSVGGAAKGGAYANKLTTGQGLLLWGTLFILSATLHAAETAMTKISPWRVAQVAEEEGKTSPFVTLSENLTQLLSTILVTTTTLSIYSTAFFVSIMSSAFPNLSFGLITALLTVFTLFFGELLPKAIAVSNSELVARKTVKSISRLATLLYPITYFFKKSSDFLLRLSGLRSIEDNSVSEDMLRMVVTEAVKTERDGIEGREGRMIQAVLDMQETAVSKIMRPRIDIDACSESCSLAELLELVLECKYSRIPVYRGDVDNIVGVVFSKDLLDFVKLTTNENENENENESVPTLQGISAATAAGDSKGGRTSSSSLLTPTGQQFAYALNNTDMITPTYFIPETMSTWNALEEMRNRRVHMAIVVDEYGGTSGLVTFEDIMEEIVGEIYDEDDDHEDVEEDATIFLKDDGTFEIKGYAELDDVYEALGMTEEEIEGFTGENGGDYSTIGGLVCSEAGEIPEEGYEFSLGRYDFSVLDVEGDRRILLLRAVKARTADSDENIAENESAGDDTTSTTSTATTESGEGNGMNRAGVIGDPIEGVSVSDSNDVVDTTSGSGSGSNMVFRDGEWVEAEPGNYD